MFAPISHVPVTTARKADSSNCGSGASGERRLGGPGSSVFARPAHHGGAPSPAPLFQRFARGPPALHENLASSIINRPCAGCATALLVGFGSPSSDQALPLFEDAPQAPRSSAPGARVAEQKTIARTPAMYIL